MALSLRDAHTEAAVRELAARKKLTMTAAIRLAVDNELAKDRAADAAEYERKLAAINEIAERAADLPRLMTSEEIDAWMYDENGLPH